VLKITFIGSAVEVVTWVEDVFVAVGVDLVQDMLGTTSSDNTAITKHKITSLFISPLLYSIFKFSILMYFPQ